MQIKLFIGFILFIVVAVNAIAQDIHYSQFDASPLNLNPALCGNFHCDFRFVANEKSQWRSISRPYPDQEVPYQTFSVSFDSRFDIDLIQGAEVGVGLQFNTDKAGDSQFGTTQIKLSGAYHQAFLDNDLRVSLGIDGGYNQNSINYDNLYFGNQWNGNQYVPTLSSGETFTENKVTYIDYTLGTNIYYNLNKKLPINFGVAFIHLNQPEKSFNTETINELDRKYNFYANAKITLGKAYTLIPSILYMNQGRYQEFNFGGLLQWRTTHVAFSSVYIGGWGRLKDAGIVKLAFDYRNVNIGISY